MNVTKEMITYEDFIRGPGFLAFRDARLDPVGVLALEFFADSGSKSSLKVNLVGELCTSESSPAGRGLKRRIGLMTVGCGATVVVLTASSSDSGSGTETGVRTKLESR